PPRPGSAPRESCAAPPRGGPGRPAPGERRAGGASGGADETIAAAPILLAGEAEYPPAREPARARVERPRHTLAGRPDAEGETERGVGALRDDPLHLIGQAQDHHALAVPTHRVEERPGERDGLGGGAETLCHLGAQIVVDVEETRRGLRVRAVPHLRPARPGRAPSCGPDRRARRPAEAPLPRAWPPRRGA